MLVHDHIERKAALSYLAVMLLCLAVVLGLSWTYTSTQRIRFLESGYPIWDAKRTLLRDCNLGQVAVFGDSRVDSAIVPARLNKVATNLGFAGGTPIENYFFAKSLLACEKKPEMVILSFNPQAFEIVQPWLWDNAMRYGAIGWEEISQIRQEAARLDDQAFFALTPKMGLDGLFRDVVYATQFPAIYFESLLASRLVAREEGNRKKFDEVIAARGYPVYTRIAGAPEAAAAAPQDAPFAPLPLQQSYFEATVAMLDRAGIKTYFLITPFNEKGTQIGNPHYEKAYLQYLGRIDAQYPNFQLLQHRVPVWPQNMFADGAHLSEDGANVFSRQLDQCVESALAGAQAECTFDQAGQTVAISNTDA